MATNQTDRPRFYEQQYLGSADLDALVDYERMARARHDLGAHSWGIAAGLQIIEKATKSGVDVYVQPGYAWDGFGRPLIVQAPYKIPSELFASIAFTVGVDDGNPAGHLVDIWLSFTATPRGGPAFGFAACTANDQYARVFESFQIVIGDKPAHADRHAPVTVGVYTVDAEQIPRKLGANTDPLLVDESIAYQTWPDNWDKARWLVPLGAVRWLPPQNPLNTGNFVARNAADNSASDHKRRYIGVVTETVDAARGFVRVRSRDSSAYAPTIWNTDTEQSLLWVEGAVRVEGDAKLLGGELLLRDAANGDSGRPLAIRRRETNSLAPAGSDLWAQIGSAESGANRFVVGPVTGTGTADFKERLVVKDDGKVGVGVPDPTAAALTVRAQGGTEDLLAFETPAGAPSWKVSTLAGGKAGLNFGETSGDGRLFLQPGGNVGIGTLEPKHRVEIHGEDNALVVVSDATSGNARNAGLELRTKAADGVTYIDFTKGSTDLANSGVPDFSARLSFNEANTSAFSMRGGKIGIETATPTNQVHINHNSGLRANRMYLSGGNGGFDGWSSLSYNACHDDSNSNWVFPDPTRRAVTIEIDDWNGYPRFEVWSTTNADTQAWLRRLRIDGESGNLVANENGGTCAIGLATAECQLHVASANNAAANVVASHVAVIDNTSTGSNAHCLALRVGAGLAFSGNNFITFFAGANDIGAIEGNGFGISYQTTYADYAEWLPREEGEAPMQPGDVVGVFAGRLRRATDGADHLLVVSTSPAVVANRPVLADRAHYQIVAMLGQVPTKVRGSVRAGDLIVPSGDADGTAIAIPSADATLQQHASAIGLAWQSSRSSSISHVRCAVGITSTHAWRSILRVLTGMGSAARPEPAASEPRKGDNKRRSRTAKARANDL
jgi:hypothetical protein